MVFGCRILRRRSCKCDPQLCGTKRFCSLGLSAMVGNCRRRVRDSQRGLDCFSHQPHGRDSARRSHHRGCAAKRPAPPRIFAPCAFERVCHADCSCCGIILSTASEVACPIWDEHSHRLCSRLPPICVYCRLPLAASASALPIMKSARTTRRNVSGSIRLMKRTWTRLPLRLTSAQAMR